MKIHRKLLLLLLLTALSGNTSAQVKNIIFLIGDGMGTSALTATLFHANGKPLEMQRATAGGMVLTYSATNRVTDSAAAATALACGIKTYNGAIGVDTARKPRESILEKAQKAGLATGIIITQSVTAATPAGFVAHVDSRKKHEEIAAYVANSNLDFLLGGGRKYFMGDSESQNLIHKFESKGYFIAQDFPEVLHHNQGRIVALLADAELPKAPERKELLPKATAKALEILKQASSRGFFIMIEGSMIDGGGHSNHIERIVAETQDFDQAVGEAFDFADQNPGTLVVVTADHETGGLSIIAEQNDEEQHALTPGLAYRFSTQGHTATMVPLFAYGTGAEYFCGIKDNTDIPKIMARLLNLE